MAHYSFINEENIVVEVITGKDESDIDSLPDGFASWEEYYESKRDGLICKRTSYNTYANTHLFDGEAFRGNFAGVGFVYDSNNDVFYEQQPFASWTLDQTTWHWKPPIPYPDDENVYQWNEETQSWDVVE